jgi:hypothetical protein
MSDIALSARISGCRELYITDTSNWDAPVTGVTIQIYKPGDTSPTIDSGGNGLNFIDLKFENVDFGLAASSTLLDGIYQIILIEEGDTAESGTLFFLGTCNLDSAIASKTELLAQQACECKDELCAALCKWRLLRDGIIARARTGNLTNVNADIAALYEIVSAEFECGC